MQTCVALPIMPFKIVPILYLEVYKNGLEEPKGILAIRYILSWCVRVCVMYSKHGDVYVYSYNKETTGAFPVRMPVI